MAMGACNKCLENIWKFKHSDGYIMATCEMCGNEVEFEARKKSKYHKKNKHHKCKKLKPDRVIRI